MSDIFWQTLIGGGVTIVLAYMQLRTKQAIERTASAAAHETRQVRNTLAETTSVTAGKLDAIHVLVNKRYGAALDRIYRLALKVAASHDTPENRADVEQAKKDMADHEAQQKIVDEGEGKPG